MNITIHNQEDAESAFLGEVLTRLAYHQRVDKVDIYVEPRTKRGWIEYLMCIKYIDTGKLTIGCLQREFGAPTEFHS